MKAEKSTVLMTNCLVQCSSWIAAHRLGLREIHSGHFTRGIYMGVSGSGETSGLAVG